MVLELRAARRRVDRDGHAAGLKDPEERGKELERRRQHDRNAAPGFQPARGEPGRDPNGGVAKLAVAEGLLGWPAVGLDDQSDVRTLGASVGVPVQYIEQRLRVVRNVRRRLDRRDRDRRRRHRSCGWQRPAGTHGAQEVAWRFGVGQCAHGQPNAERLLEAQQQLGPLEAVEPELAFEAAVGLDLRRGSCPGARFAHQFRDDAKQFSECRGIRRG